MKDTDGDMLEFTNQFINKKLFGVIKNLVILIPFTPESISVSRGGLMIEQLEVLMNTFQKNPCEMSKSIIPVLTKVKPEDTEFDIDNLRNELSQIMSNNLDKYLKELKFIGEDTQDVEITEEDVS